MEKIVDRTIVKFGFYGFFKNLRFFEPFIFLYFLAVGLNFFEIGLIISIREISMYLFEIPTGALADVWGRKKSILICFVLYVMSFFLYFLAHSFFLLALASFIFGLGEAFRLGTHKAIIFDYLDQRKIGDKKAVVYGFTRSVALFGSALSAVIATALLIWTQDYHSIFLFSIIPYLLAFFLVLTYPPDPPQKKDGVSLGRRIIAHSQKSFQSLVRVKNLTFCLINSAVFDGTFKATLDYIQPLIRYFIISYPFFLLFWGEGQTRETVLIGFYYLFINLLGAFSSRRAHRLSDYFSSSLLPLNALFFGQAFLLLVVGLLIQIHLVPVLIFFLFLHISNNVRRPLLLSYLVDQMQKEQRATMLSLESQLKSLAVIILAPTLGWIAHQFSIRIMFLSAAALLFFLYSFFLRLEQGERKNTAGIRGNK